MTTVIETSVAQMATTTAPALRAPAQVLIAGPTSRFFFNDALTRRFLVVAGLDLLFGLTPSDKSDKALDALIAAGEIIELEPDGHLDPRRCDEPKVPDALTTIRRSTGLVRSCGTKDTR